VHQSVINPLIERQLPAPGDEILIMSMTVASLLALALALVNKGLKIGLLSRLTEQVTFVLIPPLVLIFLVLGTIFLGIATPTEGGAMGALGALLMALGRRRINGKLLVQALDNTARLSVFVLFILIGSTVFSFTFNAADGHVWVEHLFDKLPGGALGFLIVVNILVFILGCFIDFFEIAFIVIPMLAPVAEKILPELLPGVPVDAVMVWFGVIIAMNLQTSFLTPPFGFALFYLRSVAAKKDYKDRVTGATIPAVSTAQIYKGSIAFIILQLIMVAAVVAFPTLVSGGLDTKGPQIDADKTLEMLQTESQSDKTAAPSAEPSASEPGVGEDAKKDEDDPMKGLLESVKEDEKKASQKK
jgi:tripartite ATP-independent transporter DctM subunit